MNLALVMDEIADKLKQHLGINVFGYPVDSITPPAAILGFPERIAYDDTYGAGDGDDLFASMPLWLVCDRSNMLTARNQVAKWTDRKGNQSVITFLEKQNYSQCDDIKVTEAAFDVITEGGVDYMAAMFQLQVVGEGR